MLRWQASLSLSDNSRTYVGMSTRGLPLGRASTQTGRARALRRGHMEGSAEIAGATATDDASCYEETGADEHQ